MATAYTSDEHRKELDALQYHVGKALAHWSAVEVQLAQLFRFALGARHEDISNSVFVAAINFNARLSMVNVAVTGYLKLKDLPDLAPHWSKLHNQAQSLSKKRNAIAHRGPQIILSMPDKKGEQRSLGARLCDVFDQRFRAEPTRALTEGFSVKQLEAWQTAFHKIAHSLYEFDQELVRRRAS